MSQSTNYVDPDINREYVIVEFPEEDNGSIPMAILSSTWVYEEQKNLFCYWPVYIKSPTQREKAIINHQALNKDKCTKCLVRVKCSSKNYDKMCKKLKHLEDQQESSQSQAESELESRKPRSSQIDLYTYSSGSDTTSELLIATPPKVKHKLFSHESTSLEKRKVQLRKENANIVSSQTRKHDSHHTTMPSNPTSVVSTDSCFQCKNNEGMLKEIINTLEKMKLDMKYIIHINQEKEQEATADLTIESLYTMEDLMALDKSLNDEEIFRHTCIKLGLIGGKDPATTTRKVLSQLISHELSLKLNWTGRNNKNGLREHPNVLKLIIGAVRRNPNSKNATIEEVELAIKSWLRNAGDRAGGRCHRREKNVN